MDNERYQETPTVVDRFSTYHLEFSLDIRIEILDKVKMIRQSLPSDQVVYPVFVAYMTFPSYIDQRLNVCVDSSQK